MKKLLKILRNTVIALVAIFILLSGFLQYVHYPSLISAVRLGLAPASKTPTLLPWHTVEPSKAPLVWNTKAEQMPTTVTYKGQSMSWQEFLKNSYTNAFLVVRDGTITYEYYNEKAGMSATTKLPSYSMAKTLTSIIIGQLIEQ